ncbi:MAG: colicin V synthesis protein [Hyphomicrobiales bacterium]|nr:MAG: colicin V synthesis protein [Hyphomicrobiales bacterium]
MPITILDGILIAVMLISAFLAMIRGFVREVLSIVSWIVAFVVALLFYKKLVPFVQQYISHEMIATAVAAGAIFLVTLIVVSYITMRVSDFVLDSRIGALDRTFGFLFGAVRGLFLVVVAMLFVNWAMPETERQPAWIAKAKSKDILDTIGDKLIAALPEDPEKRILDHLRKRGAAPESAGEAEETTSGEEPAYRSGERDGLNQLMESTGQNTQ